MSEKKAENRRTLEDVLEGAEAKMVVPALLNVRDALDKLPDSYRKDVLYQNFVDAFVELKTLAHSTHQPSVEPDKDVRDDDDKVRQDLIDRVTHDFTYKGDQSAVLKQLWGKVGSDFGHFKQAMQSYFQLKEAGVVSDRNLVRIMGYKIALREAERWCNTAIANDFTIEGQPNTLDVLLLRKHVSLSKPREEVCEYVSTACLQFVLHLCKFLPTGRALSIALTRMQDVRGWILDMVNSHYTEEQFNAKAEKQEFEAEEQENVGLEDVDLSTVPEPLHTGKN